MGFELSDLAGFLMGGCAVETVVCVHVCVGMCVRACVC